LHRVWLDGRRSDRRLSADNQRQARQKRTPPLAPGGDISSSFKARLAQSSEPELLLNTLKSQLDALAIKIARQNDRAA
jgi:hypothetical protein